MIFMNHHYTVVPYTPADFMWTQWQVEDIDRQTKSTLEEAAHKREVVIHIPSADRNFENTAAAIEGLFAGLADLAQMVDLIMNVSVDAEVRAQAQRSKETLDKAIIDYAYDVLLYEAIAAYAEQGEQLESDAQKMVADMVKYYRRSGMTLPDAERATLQNNRKRLQELTDQFQLAINERVESIIVSPEDAAGLPETYLSGLQKDELGNYIVTTKYPDYLPFMKLAEASHKRQELMDKYFSKCGQDNIQRLSEALRLRDQNARLLGYANHVAYTVEVKTAKSEEVIHTFINSLVAGLRPLVAKEMDELTAFKQRLINDSQAKVDYWETAYLQNKLRKEKLGLDSEEVKEYFPLQYVLVAMMDVYSELLSLEFRPAQGLPVWHEEVQVYAMHDKVSGELLAYFTLDLHPREAKYSHAAEFPTITGVPYSLDPSELRRAASVASMVTNFPKQTPQNPSLMSHSEVEVLFHEFGHVIHHNLSQTRFFSQSGTNVAGDFGEAPSQMLEYWVWRPQILKRISRHYKTGESMPDALIEKLVASKNFGSGLFNMRQMLLALFDFQLHTNIETDPVFTFADLWKDLLITGLPDTQLYAAGITHLMLPGYEGNYYGYMWSRVYAADMFAKFQNDGVLNPQTGMDYRQKVLAVGSSRDELESVKDFLGREPNNTAFLEELGLEKQE